MNHKSAPIIQRPDLSTLALGVVSYLNARPLHESLGDLEGLTLRPAVPAQLLAMLIEGQCDVAQLPIIDYWRHRDQLQLVSDACIASDGETLTVRVYSKQPASRITRLHVDGDSHTSIILAHILWRELYDRELEQVSWDNESTHKLDDVEALLLIGDKVIQHAPAGFGFEVDLGAAWKYVTGLPFVFAAWYGHANRDLDDLAKRLSQARDEGWADAKNIAHRYAAQHGWPEETAVRYLCDTLKYKLTDDMRTAMVRFFELAAGHGLLTDRYLS